MFFVFKMKRVPPLLRQIGIFVVLFAYRLFGEGIAGTIVGANGPVFSEDGTVQCKQQPWLFVANIIYIASLILLFVVRTHKHISS